MFNKLLLGLTPLRLSDGPRQILFCYSPFELKLPHTTFEVRNAQRNVIDWCVPLVVLGPQPPISQDKVGGYRPTLEEGDHVDVSADNAT